ncbi:unnamed protein product [Hermetia illucens]|uniref:Copper transport protein n=1 Tax=Hermetia illucens TaxID=343691 RepID=A0A7R8UQ57_HERIL|nr:high affinity copper uptake protein 1 [Hermetia illucens]CAD7084966.1 unnamed protein product [Hermetia illucens]
MDSPCRMNMYFHARACEKILWDSWQAYTVPKFVGSCIAIAIITFAYEGLKFVRDWLHMKNMEAEKSVLLSKENHSGSTECCAAPRQRTVLQQMFNWPHVIQTLLHMIQVTISYALMMIIMLCNYWLWLAIILGAGAGYFCFGWIKKNKAGGSECCY